MPNADSSGAELLNDSPTLPMEVITIIIYHIDDQQSLLSVCLTNRLVGYEGTRVLYRDLHGRATTPKLHLKLLTTLISRSELAALVRRYSATLMTIPPAHSEETLRQLIEEEATTEDARTGLVTQLLGILFSRALTLMVNLKELSHCDRGRHRNTGYLVAPGVFSGQLQVLIWFNNWNGVFIEFLKSQTALRALVLIPLAEYSIMKRPIPQSVCARLTALGGSQIEVEAILPFAPRVRTLVMHSIRRDLDDALWSLMNPDGSIAKNMHQITRLTLRNQRTHLRVFACPWNLDNLTLLALQFVVYDEAHIQFISSLKKLEFFTVLDEVPPPALEAQYEFARRLLEASKSLKRVVMPFSVAPPHTTTEHFILSRGNDLARRLQWPKLEVDRFLLQGTLDDFGIESPGWIDVGPLTVVST